MTGLATFVGWTEPITGTLLGGVSAAALAAVTGPIVLRLTGLPLIMVTLALGVIAFEAANKLTWLTGGDDGLLWHSDRAAVRRVSAGPCSPQTAYLYVLGWTFLMFRAGALCRRVAVRRRNAGHSRQQPAHAPDRHAGARQARAASTSSAASSPGLPARCRRRRPSSSGLAVLSLDTSVSALVMLVLGGVGRLYGGLIGAPVYMIVHHFASQWNPYHWMFIIGALLTVVVMFAQRRHSRHLRHALRAGWPDDGGAS